jgi:hypothetical protein
MIQVIESTYNKEIGDIWVAIEEQYKFTNINPPRPF